MTEGGEVGEPVILHLYDLSQGLARQLSANLLGRQIDGIWHTGVTVYGREYYFGGGICVDAAGRTPYGTPIKRIPMGSTTKTRLDLFDFLRRIAPQYTAATYHLVNHNCNNFSNALTNFLTDKSIPQYILDLPREALSSPLGQVIEPMINQVHSTIQSASEGHQFEASPTTSPSPSKGGPCPTLSSVLRSPVVLQSTTDLKTIHQKLRTFAPDFSKPDSVSDLLSILPTLSLSQAFPALDLLRIHAFRSKKDAIEIARALKASLIDTYVLQAEAPASAKLMALRAMVNVLREEGARGLLKDSNKLVDAVERGLRDPSEKVRLTAGMVVMNLCRNLPQEALEEEQGTRLAWALCERLNKLNVADGKREPATMLYALGALLHGGEEVRDFVITMELSLDRFTKDGIEHVKKVAAEVQALLVSEP